MRVYRVTIINECGRIVDSIIYDDMKTAFEVFSSVRDMLAEEKQFNKRVKLTSLEM